MGRLATVTANWSQLLASAAAIVEQYDTGVTLRQLLYQLVLKQLPPNTQAWYKSLSHHTANARRAGTFPALIDRTRHIHRGPAWSSPAESRNWLAEAYRRDRTEEEPCAVYLVVEKAGIVEQLSAWFGNRGLPILPLGGYSSQSFVEQVMADVSADVSDRRAVLLYAGDFDAGGEDSDRDFIDRADVWAEVHRVALTPAQVQVYQSPENPGKTSDSRAGAFHARHGRLVQVELDALAPDVLRSLFEQAIAEYWNETAYEAGFTREAWDQADLAADGGAR